MARSCAAGCDSLGSVFAVAGAFAGKNQPQSRTQAPGEDEQARKRKRRRKVAAQPRLGEALLVPAGTSPKRGFKRNRNRRNSTPSRHAPFFPLGELPAEADPGGAAPGFAASGESGAGGSESPRRCEVPGACVTAWTVFTSHSIVAGSSCASTVPQFTSRASEPACACSTATC